MKSMRRFFGDRFTILIFVLIIFALSFRYVELATSMLIFGILALSFNLMLGFAGLLSFGHAALFAIGAYTMGILLIHYKINLFLGLAAGSLITALTALIVGWVSIRRHGIYFAMLTLAFNEVVYFTILEMKDLTGGDDGLRGIFRPDLDLGLLSIPIQKPIPFYFFVLFFFILSTLIMRRIIHSPLGSVFMAIRENENRAETIGYNPRDYKIIAFLVSGFFAGLAGSLFCIQIKYVALSFSHWSLSGEVIIMALVGGIGSLYGPIVGAAIVMAMQDIFSNMWDRWLLVLGLVFVIFVMFFPGGIWGGIENLIFRYSRLFKKEFSSRS